MTTLPHADTDTVPVRWQPPHSAFTTAEWYDAGRTLAGADTLLRLRIAYWIRYGRDRWWEWGEVYANAHDVTGLSQSTLQEYVSVSHQLTEAHQRRLVLSGAPWRTVRTITWAPGVQHETLVCAVEDGDTYDDVRYLIDAAKPTNGGAPPTMQETKVKRAARDIVNEFSDEERVMLVDKLTRGGKVAPRRKNTVCPQCGCEFEPDAQK